jgi:hypothetical protein
MYRYERKYFRELFLLVLVCYNDIGYFTNILPSTVSAKIKGR